MVQYFSLFYFLTFFLLSQFSLHAESVPKKQKGHNTVSRLNCRQIYKILAHKKKIAKKKLLKNKLFFCDGYLVSSMLTDDGYESVPEIFHRWVKKYKKAYVFHIAHQSLDSKKKKYVINFYLLSSDKESKAILSKKQKLEFSGQIVQKPILIDKSWHFLVLKEETVIKIE